MNLDVICTVIEAAGLGTRGKNLFQLHMPDQVEAGIQLRPPMQGITINHYQPGFLKGPLQVIVRAADYESGQAKAEALMKALEIYNQDYFDTSGAFLMRINYMRPRTLPISYPRTPGNNLEWSINFDACYVMELP